MAHYHSLQYWCVLLLSSLLLSACGQTVTPLTPLPENAVILAFGDSLTYGSGASTEQSYPARLAELTGRTVINAGVPGELSTAGKDRLAKILAETKVDLVILCHGGNDLLRKQSRPQLQANLQAMIDTVKNSGAQVVLVAVPRLGIGLAAEPLYMDIAAANDLPIEKTVLKEVLSEPGLKSDPIHPNAAGYEQLANSLYQLLMNNGAFGQ